MSRLSGSLALAFFLLAAAAPARAAQITKLTAPDGGPDHDYGLGLALSGDTLAVGARGAMVQGQQVGQVYVYVLQAGAWIEQARLSASDGEPWDGFGEALALDGDVLAVGAPYEDQLGNNAGAVYMFERIGTGWSQVAKLVAPDGKPKDQFGKSMAVQGTTLVLGVPYDDAPVPDSGSVWVYERRALGWIPRTKLIPVQAGTGDLLGLSVALSGDWILSGAPDDDDAGYSAGSIYWFQRSGSTWVQTAKQLPAPGQGTRFGSRVALDADVAAVSSAAWGGPGRVHLHRRSGTNWLVEAVVAGDPGPSTTHVGGLAVHGERVAMGIPNDSSAGVSGAGAVYVFAREGGQWPRVAKLVAPDAEPGDRLGNDVALDGPTLAAGAPWDDDLGDASGAVYVLEDDFDIVQPFCLGAAPAACPCGNVAASGGCANATGSGGELQRTGSVSVGLDDLELHATALPPFQPAVLVMGTASAPPSSLGDGLLCLGAPVYRFPAAASDAAGTASWGPGLAALSSLLFPAGAQLAPGETRLFQTWHRDPAGPCGSSTNLTSGLEITFLP